MIPMEEVNPSATPADSPRRCYQCDGTGQFRTAFRMEFCFCPLGCATKVDRGLVSYWSLGTT